MYSGYENFDCDLCKWFVDLSKDLVYKSPLLCNALENTPQKNGSECYSIKGGNNECGQTTC